ncbi:alpha/beta hydrolase fold protein (plasmid) [Haloterrigena turkmenica DSM 5511]|uniref:Palmitoyl-protein thioesterase ABHD10, mitochondrial n=1 Tax=Haloterrigena turkmenica (strain ATCC 51198 / DSM 5511 / JCM 9101 / NCIMB 13204 / VKM B-1734 / 4k) TaxID=543526 RepID=D2S327_HALTV|nr:alpha/beta hydrolase [Haloterrigena turkmenica]ADB63774.1 alpha/beta hydrolase fold protein [Haloterrigena turkmenica DSM 5511]
MTETEHRVTVADGETVAAVHHEAPGDDWIVFCHGFLSDKTGSYERRCRRAVEHGYNAVRFDFRGCGASDGRFVDQTLSDKLADLHAVLEYVAPPSIVLFGSSFGGKVAFHAAVDDERVEAVATRAPVTYNRAFDEYRAIVEREDEPSGTSNRRAGAKRHASREGPDGASGETASEERHANCAGIYEFETGDRIDARFFDDFETYEFDDVAASLSVPVAIFHGRDDDSVDIGDSVDAAAALETDVLLEAFATEGHRFSADAEDRLLERLFHWLETQ